MTTVAGIDLSLTSTGLALATVHRPTDAGLQMDTIETWCATSTGKKNDSLAQRNQRQHQLSKQILEFVVGADLVVIENLFNSQTSAAGLLDRCGTWWRVVDNLLYSGTPVVGVVASQAKKFLTGAGNADKGTMVRWAGKLWPDWEPSTPSKTEDEADAIALASIGLGVLDLAPFEMPAHRRDIVAKVRSLMKESDAR